MKQKASRTTPMIAALLAAIMATGPSWAREPWSQFRGPQENGHSQSTGLPLQWDLSNVSWTAEIHDRGWSSPVIWDDQIWLTTATKDGHQLFALCVDKQSGAIVHDTLVFEVESPQAITVDNTYATPTPAIESGRVYVHYGTYGTACLDTGTGKILWTRRDLNCDHEKGAGPASSPFLHEDFLIFHVDGRDVQYVIALHKASGETAWKTARSTSFEDVPVNQRKAYGMPLLAPRGEGLQMISIGAKCLYSYEPDTGRELWKVRNRGWSVAPRPVHGDGLVFAVIDRDRPELWAIRHNGTGDVTDTHTVWKKTRRMPQRVSPILVEGRLFVMERAGYLTCLDAASGEEIWQERLKGRFSASPIFANGHLYFFNEEAVSTVIKPESQFTAVATNSLGEEETLMASPAVDTEAFYIRTETHLYKVSDNR